MTPEATNAHWYAVRAQLKREALAVAHIRERCALDVYCPHLTLWKKTRLGPRRFTEALFPGYLFVHCELAEARRHINAMPGVCGVVHFRERTPHIPPGLIEELRTRLGGEHYECTPATLAKDTTVQITRGPFTDFVGRICHAPKGGERVELLLEFLGQTLRVSLPRAELLPLEAPIHPLQARYSA